jgi:hypothetical protein
MKKYSIVEEPESGSVWHFHDQHTRRSRQSAVDRNQSQNAEPRVGIAQTSSVDTTSQHERARLAQITYEHARLTTFRLPVDPYAKPNAGSKMWSALMRDQKILLERICSKPSLIGHHVHTRERLEETPLKSADELRKNAKAAIEAHLGIAEAMTENRLPPEMQEIHKRIPASEDLSNRAKFILIMVTFISRGRYTTFTVMREWAIPFPDNHIRAALKKARIQFDCTNVPIHPIIESNWRICDLGDHLSDLDDDVGMEFLQEEGIKFDKNGRILGGAFQFRDVEEMTKGTMIEKYIDRPYQFGGWK